MYESNYSLIYDEAKKEYEELYMNLFFEIILKCPNNKST